MNFASKPTWKESSCPLIPYSSIAMTPIDFAHGNGKQRSNDILLLTSVTHLHFIKAMFRSCSRSPLRPTRPSFNPSNARALLSLSDGGCKQTGICGGSYIHDDKWSAFRRIC